MLHFSGSTNYQNTIFNICCDSPPPPQKNTGNRVSFKIENLNDWIPQDGSGCKLSSETNMQVPGIKLGATCTDVGRYLAQINKVREMYACIFGGGGMQLGLTMTRLI